MYMCVFCVASWLHVIWPYQVQPDNVLWCSIGADRQSDKSGRFVGPYRKSAAERACGPVLLLLTLRGMKHD